MIQIQLVSYAQSRHLPRLASTFGLFSAVSSLLPRDLWASRERVAGERRAGIFSGEARVRTGVGEEDGKGMQSGSGARREACGNSRKGNVGDNLPLRRFRLRTTNHPFLPCILSCLAPLSPHSFPSSAVRFVLHLGAYRTESLYIPMTTG